MPGVHHVRNPNRYHRPPEESEADFTAFLLDELEQTIEAAGPETIAMVIFEPVQNAGGAFPPPKGYCAASVSCATATTSCSVPTRSLPALAASGHGPARSSTHPADLMTIAKGLSSSYAAIGAVVASDRVMEPFMEGRGCTPTGSPSVVTR